jgi:hypothetical protein
VPIGGKPMVRWPVEALLASDRFSQVRVLAQEPERIGAALPAHPKLVVEQSAASIAATLETLCFDPTVRWPLFVTTADHVLLDAGMIDELCDLGEPADIAIGVVERDNLMARLPQSRRTWIRFAPAHSAAPTCSCSAGRRSCRRWSCGGRSSRIERKPGRCCGRSGRSTSLARHCACARSTRLWTGSGAGSGAKVEAVDLSDPLAAVDVDKLADHGLVETLLRSANERPCDLRSRPDDHPARDLHAVPDPLRASAGSNGGCCSCRS